MKGQRHSWEGYMRRFTIALVCILMVLLAGNAAADVGLFTSYSATTMRSPGGATLNISVGTTGYVPTSTTDYLYVFVSMFPTGTTGTGTYGSTYIPRTGAGATAFSRSFSITGLSESTNYKWAAVTIGDVGGYGYGFTAFYFVYYFLYVGCLPFPAYSLYITTPGSPGVPQPVVCTTTPTGGPFYDFWNSDVNTFQSTANWWSTYYGSPYPIFAHGVATGLLFLTAIPTLASWGLMALGALVGLTGVILLRRI